MLVGVNNKELNPDVKHSAADLKTGAGNITNEEGSHNNFFSEPVMKVKSTTMGPPPAQPQDSKQKRKIDTPSQSGGGHTVKKPKLSGRGVSFK